MKRAFYVLTFFLAALAVRMTDDGQGILPEIICVSFAIICFYCGTIWNDLQENKRVK